MVLISSSFVSDAFLFSKYVCMCGYSMSVCPDVVTAGLVITEGQKLKTACWVFFFLFTVSFELTNRLIIIIIIIIYFIQMFVLLF